MGGGPPAARTPKVSRYHRLWMTAALLLLGTSALSEACGGDGSGVQALQLDASIHHRHKHHHEHGHMSHKPPPTPLNHIGQTKRHHKKDP